jgi:hypothetical protein
VRQRFVDEGLELALSSYRTERREYRPKLDGELEARLIALAFSQPPEGRTRWTLRMFADAMVELELEARFRAEYAYTKVHLHRSSQ